ncbi:MAG: sigma-70 family RNA polymerase sigma factor [Prosthecobacter sp.]
MAESEHNNSESAPHTNTEWFIDQVRREQAALRAFARSLGVRAEGVDDVAQEALILAFEKLAEFDRTQPFGPWVRGIARRLVANLLRKESRREELMSQAVTEALLVQEQAHETQAEPLGAGAGAEFGFGTAFGQATEERLGALRVCLETLPEKSRHLVRWRYFDELAPAVIAERLGRTANDVRQMFFRLRRALLECIEQRLARAGEPGAAVVAGTSTSTPGRFSS